jgi:hypothetical protein
MVMMLEGTWNNDNSVEKDIRVVDAIRNGANAKYWISIYIEDDGCVCDDRVMSIVDRSVNQKEWRQ